MRPFMGAYRQTGSRIELESRSLAAALFGWGWLSVYVTSLNESRIVQVLGSGGGDDRIEWMRTAGDRERADVGRADDDILEPSDLFLSDFDLDDWTGLGRGGRGSGARDDGPDPVPPGSALGVSRVSGFGRIGGLGNSGASDPGGCLDRHSLQCPA